MGSGGGGGGIEESHDGSSSMRRGSMLTVPIRLRRPLLGTGRVVGRRRRRLPASQASVTAATSRLAPNRWTATSTGDRPANHWATMRGIRLVRLRRTIEVMGSIGGRGCGRADGGPSWPRWPSWFSRIAVCRSGGGRSARNRRRVTLRPEGCDRAPHPAARAAVDARRRPLPRNWPRPDAASPPAAGRSTAGIDRGVRR